MMQPGHSVTMFFTCLFVSLIAVCRSSDPSTTVSPAGVSGNPALGIKCSASKTIICKDCENLQICGLDSQGDIASLITVNCKTQDRYKPYCDTVTNSCGNIYRDGCSGDVLNCPDKGYYPDTLDCNKYIYCQQKSDGSFLVQSFVCPGSLNYDQQTKLCGAGQRCYSFSSYGLCRGKTGALVAYPPSKDLFSYCPGDGSKPRLFKCPEKKLFNENTGVCEFDCVTDGRFADPTNATVYYECTGCSTACKTSVKFCSAGYKFDEGEGACLDSN